MGAGRTGRPEWFWHPEQYGGILADIGSHQVDQFLFYTGSTKAQVVASQIANVRHHDHPEFQDFGDMMLRGDAGFGYVRLDWFTPEGLGTWGDGRLFILGTDGYIELRKYVDVAGRPGGNHLFVVNKDAARYIDCNNLVLPFGPQFIGDVGEPDAHRAGSDAMPACGRAGDPSSDGGNARHDRGADLLSAGFAVWRVDRRPIAGESAAAARFWLFQAPLEPG